MLNRYIVIMAGGQGQRFWPESRKKFPKHFLAIVGDKPMLIQTIDRVSKIVPQSNIFIITNNSQYKLVVKLCTMIKKENIISEPFGCNTTAVVTLASFLIKKKDPNASFCILPADHYIDDIDKFKKTILNSFFLAESGNFLVTIGVKPSYPSISYGYIEKGNKFLIKHNVSYYLVNKFVEKPSYEKAKEYLFSKKYFWNTGIFVFQTNSIINVIKNIIPNTYNLFNDFFSKTFKNYKDYKKLYHIYNKLESISIDYSIMEKANNVITIESSFIWDDVGSWTSLERHIPKNNDNNNKNSLIATIGIENLIIVYSKKAILICKKELDQEIKSLIKLIDNNPQYIKFL